MACAFKRPGSDAKTMSTFFQSFTCPYLRRQISPQRPCRECLVLEDPFITGRRLPQHILSSHPKPRQTQMQIHSVTAYTCTRVPTHLSFSIHRYNSLKCSTSHFLSGLGCMKMAADVGPDDENLLLHTHWSQRSALLTFLSQSSSRPSSGPASTFC